MRIDLIKDIGVRVMRKIIGYKLNHSFRLNFVIEKFLHVAYLMVIKKKRVNLYEIVRLQLIDNIEKIKRSRSIVFRFESLSTHLFFYATTQFLGMTTSSWNSSECMMKVITQCYRSKAEVIRDDEIARMIKKF